MEDKYILGIESSCDETSIAIVKNGREVISNVISSQIDIHKIYGGVVPEIASRNHTKNIDVVLSEALTSAGISLKDISAVAVTYGAGLLGALIVGVSFAKTLAYSLGVPLYGVNHIEGHIAANYIAHKDLKPPFVCLVVSGGHTCLFDMKDYTNKKLLGTTQDDAVGEAFDKISRELGFGYPGGPKIQKAAESGEKNITFISKPHAKDNLNFSYSGLKTAVINYLHNKKQKNEEINANDVARSFEEEAVDQLVEKSILACKKTGEKKIVVAGGVSANQMLRDKLTENAKKEGIETFFPPLILCTDNAAMIASQAYYNLLAGKKPDDLSLGPKSTISL